MSDDLSQKQGQAFLFKVLVVGEASVGKTALVRKYVHNVFNPNYKATVGVDFALKKLDKGDDVVRLQLWDVAGQERYGTMARVYYKDAVGAVVVFDVTRPSTYEAVEHWKRDIDEKVELPDGSPLPCILLANKIDLLGDEGLVAQKKKELEDFCQQHNFISFFPTSAKTGDGVNESVEYLADAILEQAPVIQKNSDALIVAQADTDPVPTKSCC